MAVKRGLSCTNVVLVEISYIGVIGCLQRTISIFAKSIMLEQQYLQSVICYKVFDL